MITNAIYIAYTAFGPGHYDGTLPAEKDTGNMAKPGNKRVSVLVALWRVKICKVLNFDAPPEPQIPKNK